MAEEDDPKPVYLDLVKLINNDVGEKIVTLLAETGSPYNAIATIGAVIASVVTSIVDQEDKVMTNIDTIAVTSIVDQEDKVMTNIDTIATFSKELAQSILKRIKDDPDTEEIELNGEGNGETLH